MGLHTFIESHFDGIMAAWALPRPHVAPPAPFGNLEQLRADILRSIVEAAHGSEPPTDAIGEAARAYATARLVAGSPLDDIIREYQALRTIILDKWRAADCDRPPDPQDVDELITFEHHLHTSLAEACRGYMARFEDARELLNGVLAHDLRTPLAAILTSAETLALDRTLSGRQQKIAARIKSSGRRMQGMIADLLDFTRTRLRTALPVSLQSGNVGTLVKDVVAEVSTSRPNTEIVSTLEGDLTLLCDPARIEQMVSNLLGNAIEHGEQNKPVTVDARGSEVEITIRVHNHGQAISPREQEVIFFPMIRAALRRQSGQDHRKGLGLGLYIARQIAEAHRGTIVVTSRDPEGTTFTVRLPKPGHDLTTRALPGTDG